MKRGERIPAALKPSFVLPLLFLGVMAHATIAMAQSAGTFISAARMR